MSRWAPNARGRLEQAALDLFSEQGFERTTVGEIAARAGLVQRTFFRHFADKREVLFWGYSELADHFTASLGAARGSLAPIEAVVAALEVAAARFPDRPDFSRRRNALIAATPELQERERLKLAALADAITEALSRRDLAETPARLTGEAGIAIFKVAYERWIANPEAGDFPARIRQTFHDLRLVMAADQEAWAASQTSSAPG